MNIDQIRKIQESLVYNIFFSESFFDEFSKTQSKIPIEIFWAYTPLARLAIGKSWEEVQLQAISTEIIKLWLSDMMADVMTTAFSFPNFYEDIKILVKELIMGKSWEEFDKLVNIQKIFLDIDEKKASNMAKSFLIENLYDEAIIELDRRSERKKQGKILGYEMWFPLLDKYTEWMQKGTLIRLNAYANVGKSKFSYQIVNNILDQGAHIIYFTLEVNSKQVIYNLIANKYKMSIQDVYKMKFDEIDFWELFKKNLEIVDKKYELDDILAYSNMRKPDMIVIDFVQNIQSPWSEYERMTNIAVKLQQFAIKNNIAVFDISQISNEWAKSQDSDVIHSKWSGALVASADIGLVMKRDKIDENIITIKIAKNKFWWRKSMDYRIDYETGVFTEVGESLISKII